MKLLKPRFLIISLVILAGIAGVSAYLLSQNDTNYLYASTDYKLQFPKDHASHPKYQNEWWYYTGHLTAENGRKFGFQITFFRVGLTPEQQKESKWRSNTFYFGHMALTDKDGKKFYYTEKVSRGGEFDNTEAREDIYKVRLDNWRAELLGKFHHLEASGDSINLNLVAIPLKSPVLQGINGYSQKGADTKNASMYYSLTRNSVQGVLFLNGEPMTVSGECWMDHEFGTSQLTADQTGWDWFSLQMSDTTELMLFKIRKKDGSVEVKSHGAFVDSKGNKQELTFKNDYTIEVLKTWKSPHSGAEYPVQWKVRVPSQQIDYTITAIMDDQELKTENSARIVYWEGAVSVEGTKAGRKIAGQGYTEMTGYAGAVNALQ
ncbi:MAG: lipocalin-like domain-containing protein [Bacteroidota bacterium]